MTRNQSLEWLRGLAALYVFASHFKEIAGAHILGESLAVLRFGPEIVMLFFLLSGTVIRLSVRNQNPSRWVFLQRRALRILPLYWLALLLSIVLEWQWGELPEWQNILGHLLFLQTQEGFITTVFQANDPLWSLSFEAFFYVLYAVLMGRWLVWGMRVWCIVAGLAMLVQWQCNPTGILGHFVLLFAYSSLWLLGYHLPTLAKYVQVSWTSAITWAALMPMMSRLTPMDLWQYHWALLHFLVGLCMVPLVLHGLQNNSSGRQFPLYSFVGPYIVLVYLTWEVSPSTSGARIVYAILPPLTFISSSLFIPRQRTPLNWWPMTGMWFGRTSYSLYVLHAPCIYFANHVAPTFLTRFLLVLILVPCVMLFGEYIFHSYFIRIVQVKKLKYQSK